MTFEALVLAVSEHGVRVRIGRAEIWLPLAAPGVTWCGTPDVDAVLWVRLPTWVVNKHHALQEFRYQRSIAFHQGPTDLGPSAHIKGSFPMTEQTNERRGALFRETEKKSEKAPDMTGHLTLDGVRYRLAGWTREDKNGRKYLSIVAEPPKDQPPTEQTPRQQYGGRMPTEEIPFGPEF